MRGSRTRDQDLAAQDAELRWPPAAPRCSRRRPRGAKTDRPELAKVIRRLEPGDVLVVVRLDRLARSTRDLLNVLDEISKRGAGFRSLKDSLGRHHDAARQADADGARRSCRVRACADPSRALARAASVPRIAACASVVRAR